MTPRTPARALKRVMLPDYQRKASAWQTRHYAALADPDPAERPFVELWDTIDALADRFGDDGLLREYVGQMIVAAEGLLNADTGRLDQGELNRTLEATADRIGFDLSEERFTD